jgi:hypothetical protein
VTHRQDRRLATRGLARVEGEGAMYVRVSDGHVDEVRLDIYEPPRFLSSCLAEPPGLHQGKTAIRSPPGLGGERMAAW